METYTVDSLMQCINDSVMEIGQAEGMRKYLKVLSNNPEFGLIESICLYIQYPQGKLLYSFTHWKNRYGRHVKPDATGIKILTFDEDDIPKISTLFDISQTEGKALVLPEDEKIRNKEAQEECGRIIRDEIRKQAILKRIPINALLCEFTYYILFGHFCMEYPDLNNILRQYSCDDRRYINAYLKELSELTGNVYRSLINTYLNEIKSLARIEPEKEASVHDLKVPKDEKKVATSQQKPIFIKGFPEKHMDVPDKKKKSVLEKLRQMQKLAKIYNEQRQG